MRAEDLAQTLHAHRVGGEWRARCPAHRGDGTSLSIRDGDIGVLVYCWSHGCSLHDICRAAGIKPRDLFYDPEKGLATQRARREAMQSAGDGWWKDRQTGALWIVANDGVRRLMAQAEAARKKGHALGDPEGWAYLELAARLETEAHRQAAALDEAAE
jgi:hypothetical protein